jgi:hypothetical protein
LIEEGIAVLRDRHLQLHLECHSFTSFRLWYIDT